MPQLQSSVLGRLCTAAAVLASIAAAAQMPSPEIDRSDRPFSYFAKPTDQIGVAGSPSATEITPEGFLYTGYGELMFFVGSDWAPLDTNSGPRLRTLEDGYLPIQKFDVERDGLTYHFTMFSAALGKQPEGPVANFIRVTVENRGSEPRAAFLSTAMRFQAPQLQDTAIPDNRFNRPANPAKLGPYRQPGETFSPYWVYKFDGNAFVRDGKVMYMFAENPKPVLGHTLLRRYNHRPTTAAGMQPATPNTPMGAARYTFVVAPGEKRSIDLKMPLLPIERDSSTIAALDQATFDDYHDRVRDYWRTELARGMQVAVPEQKVNDLYRTCMLNDLLALDHIGDDWVQTVNQTHYHSFYLRDASDFVHMYDVTGRSDVADKVLRFYAQDQQPDGNFLSHRGQFDGWGQTLWIYGFHYRFTHDQEFAQRVYPSIVRAVEWFEKSIAADPLHLMPATDVKDNEFIPGHLTGYNFLALDGLQGAIAIGKGLGKTEDVQRFQRDYNNLRKNFFAVLDKRTAANHNYIPPGLDGDMGGADWGNLLGITPEPQLDPHDKRISATLAGSQSGYEEGILIFNQPGEGKYLHHYLTIKNTLTEVVRGNQEQAIKEYYALLLHTSATNSGFEYAIRPWGDRDFAGNLTPHGWFAAEFRNLTRAMLVREEDDRTLHLLSAISPEWVGAGKTIRVDHAPTMWGDVDFELLSTGENVAELRLKNSFTKGAPEKVFLHLPWFMHVDSVQADGHTLRAVNGAVELPLNTTLVKLNWTRTANVTPLSYASTVDAYKADYRKHYDEYLRTGVPYAE